MSSIEVAGSQVSRPNGICSAAATLVLALLAPLSNDSAIGVAALERMQSEYARPREGALAPQDNQTTVGRAALGRQLFFDPRLSSTGLMACSTCHNPNNSWEDGMATSAGRDGRFLLRSTPTILNAAWGGPYFSDGRADTLEQQALDPISSTREMNLPHSVAVARVTAIAGYREAFARTYGAVTITNIGKALAAFERTITSGEAPFDRWIAGDANAISASARRGFVLFNTTARCNVCHSSWRFTDDGFHDVGVGAVDEGRAAIAPGIEELRYAFKTPTLRNIDQRAPYMHDGSLPSLEAVMAFYNAAPTQRPSLSPDMAPLHLSRRETGDIIAFLQTLTSDDDAATAPTLPQ
jgi:cytochrome c peroxidase